jgi:hypothetical protein
MLREARSMHAMSVETWDHGDRHYEYASMYSVTDDCWMHELTETAIPQGDCSSPATETVQATGTARPVEDYIAGYMAARAQG